MKRQRGRNRNNKNTNRNSNHNNHNRSLDSQGPGVKVRGNAATIYEKYTTLARDAKMSGSRVNAENLLQHAEHYLRLMNVQEAAKREAQEARDKADAERAARHAERGETGGDDDGDTRNTRRNNNRNHNNNRRDREEPWKVENKTEDTSDSKSDAPAELDLVEPVAEAPKVKAKPRAKKVEATETVDAEDKPTRRRKAPSRKSEDTVDAAE